MTGSTHRHRQVGKQLVTSSARRLLRLEDWVQVKGGQEVPLTGQDCWQRGMHLSRHCGLSQSAVQGTEEAVGGEAKSTLVIVFLQVL